MLQWDLGGNANLQINLQKSTFALQRVLTHRFQKTDADPREEQAVMRKKILNQWGINRDIWKCVDLP